ncbi:hypothetical protein LIER_42293 [Lithospermum erythrorhizon]|uniref:Uncharacterized protein n=1 Tax=Lithospermum erythrorhizon TaxID=34254 RepID=A0AAV3RT26_LITER
MKILEIMSSLGHGHNVPNDTIFYDILPKLPVESLIRSQCTTLNFPYEFVSISGGTMVNNCLHWIVHSYIDDDYNNNNDDDNVGGSYYNDFWDLRFVNRIVYFDSPINEFKIVSVPDSIEIEGEEKILVDIGVLDEYLCMMRPFSSGGKEQIYVNVVLNKGTTMDGNF